MSTDSLQYLSTDQALADLATFRVFIHERYNLTDSNQWVAFGGSYPGILGSWLRLKYPHLIHAAVSSSAPLERKVDYPEYLEVVNTSLSAYSPECSRQIQAAFQAVQETLSQPNGSSKIEEAYKYKAS
jgi:hypothetical protein